MQIGIVGLGLIGGSFAKAFKAKTAHRVAGFDIDPETMAKASAAGAIDTPLTEEELAKSDVVIVALTPKNAVAWVKAHTTSIAKDAIVVDVCGVKRFVMRELLPIAREHSFTFVGGHPMAGKERGGFDWATETLYERASMILTPAVGTPEGILKKLENLFLPLGFAQVTITTPETHDRNIAYTSQLAHVASNAYIKNPVALEHAGFSAGSFKDLTRVARLNEAMWTELFALNRDYLVHDLKLYIENLNAYLKALEAGDDAAMITLLRDGREKKEASEK